MAAVGKMAGKPWGRWRRMAEAVAALAAVAENGGEPRRPWRRMAESRAARGGSCGGKAVAEAMADKWPAIPRV